MSDFNVINLSLHNEIGFSLLTNLYLSGIYKYEKVDTKDFVQYKLMLELKIPKLKKKEM